MAPLSLVLLYTLCGTLAAAAPTYTTPVEHVVLLMLENRAFDHMLGLMDGVDGYTLGDPRFSNPWDTEDPTQGRCFANNTSPFVAPLDPNHSTPPTTAKIFGKACLDADPPCDTPTMDGFAEFALGRTHDKGKAASLLNGFTPERVPVLSTLASEFLVFDRYHASHPGPTFPNRLFQLMGTSSGCTETGTWDDKTLLYKGRTVFDIAEEAGADWRYYFADAPLELALLDKFASLESLGKLHGWSRFMEDIGGGDLPFFSWVNPRWFPNITSFAQASDQHPDHDVRQGELLVKQVYEALRASPAWEKTALIITYDEHGGFWDHVPPPQDGVPPPGDNRTSYPDKDFKFDRLGVRVPTVLVSPWVKRGTVVSEPSGAEKPQPTSRWDLTSVISTVRRMVKTADGTLAAPLTQRDAWAATFDGRFRELQAPRTDCPATLPDVPTASPRHGSQEDAARAEGDLPLNDLQRDIVEAYARLAGESGRPVGEDELAAVYEGTQHEAGQWVAEIARLRLQSAHHHHQ